MRKLKMFFLFCKILSRWQDVEDKTETEEIINFG